MKIINFVTCFKCEYFRSRATSIPTCDCKDLSNCVIRKNNEINCRNCLHVEVKETSTKAGSKEYLMCKIRRGNKCGDREFKYPYHTTPEFIEAKEMQL